MSFAQAPAPLPDLTAAYIGLSPRYPAYAVRDVDGFPAAISPASGAPLSEGELAKIQRWPRRGEKILATGRVVNHGTAPSGPFRYTWSLDGKTVAQGRHDGLAPDCRAVGRSDWVLGGLTLRESTLREGTFVDLPFSFKWKERGQRLRLAVRLESSSEEVSVVSGADEPGPRDNNAREERTDGLGFLVTVPTREYNEWRASGAPGQHAGFEDWVQAQFELIRGRLQGSAYSEVPQGVEQPIRIDSIRVVDEPAGMDEAAASAGWDGVWSYPAMRKAVSAHALPPDELHAGLFRAVLRQLGLVDLSTLTVLPDGLRGVEDSGPPLIGYVHPTVAPAGPGALGEHSVHALNRMRGQRRGFRGTYLFDLPRICRFRVLDNNGKMLPNAAFSVFQKEGPAIGPKPVFEGATNADGEFPLPNRPAPSVKTADGFTLRDNPFGALRTSGENGLLLVRIQARSQTDYLWVPVTSFNLAAWRGQSRLATFELRTRIPAASAPPPPLQLTAQREGQGQVLKWRAPPLAEIGGYVVYRGVYPTYAWERIGAVTYLNETFLDPARLEGIVRYAVTAVDVHGDESGFADATVAPLVD